MDYVSLVQIVEEMELMGIPREKTVLYLYESGIGCCEGLTQKQCAEVLGVSRSAIVDIEDRALMKLQERLDHDNRD